MSDPHYSFAHRLRLALWWNARWGIFRAAGKDALLDLIDGAGNTVLFLWALLRLLTLPAWVFVVSPFYIAVRYRGSAGMKAFRDVDRVLSRERQRDSKGGEV